MEYKGKHWISVVAMFGIPNILSALWSYIFCPFSSVSTTRKRAGVIPLAFAGFVKLI